MFRLTVQDVFFIRGRGLVAIGRVELGQVRVGDEVRINGARAVQVEAIEQFRKKLDEAMAGDNIGLLFSGLERSDVSPGDVLTSGGVELSSSGGVEVSL
jgi:translation elongation factor EF-Tu-like GTPase